MVVEIGSACRNEMTVEIVTRAFKQKRKPILVEKGEQKEAQVEAEGKVAEDITAETEDVD